MKKGRQDHALILGLVRPDRKTSLPHGKSADIDQTLKRFILYNFSKPSRRVFVCAQGAPHRYPAYAAVFGESAVFSGRHRKPLCRPLAAYARSEKCGIHCRNTLAYAARSSVRSYASHNTYDRSPRHEERASGSRPYPRFGAARQENILASRQVCRHRPNSETFYFI